MKNRFVRFKGLGDRLLHTIVSVSEPSPAVCGRKLILELLIGINQTNTPDLPVLFQRYGQPPDLPVLFQRCGQPPDLPVLFQRCGQPPDLPVLFQRYGQPPDLPVLFQRYGQQWQ